MTAYQKKPRIVLGVGSGIAAYKVVSLLRIWKKRGYEVVVMPTPDSFNFVGKATWEALSNHQVVSDFFSDASHVVHVEYARDCDAIVIAPATADLIAQLAHGTARTPLTATVLSSDCPVIICPAMHTRMYHHPATVKNLSLLSTYGYHVMAPQTGDLTSGDIGIGRLSEPPDIDCYVSRFLSLSDRSSAHDNEEKKSPFASQVSVSSSYQPLRNKNVLITAGGTREPIDPVRFITNASSGRQGIALACQAYDYGAHVTLILGTIDERLREKIPKGITIINAQQAQAMDKEVMKHDTNADVIIMCAAVADFRPCFPVQHKLKKDDGELCLQLEKTPDILLKLTRKKASHKLSCVIVGFSAETGDKETILDYARAKFAKKHPDLLVVNDVSHSKVFGKNTNSVTILGSSATSAKKEGVARIITTAQGTKDHVAHAIWESILAMVD